MEVGNTRFIDTRKHLLLLDALRGVAALVVIWYHCYEGFATSVLTQGCNHGYLAVDFFFILSGFVIGYAYDGRFSPSGMSTWTFFKRRLIRLHPMVIFGAVFGALTFIISGRHDWSGGVSPMSMVMLALLLNMFMLPMAPGMRTDVRGNGELFPLNGPAWSLFFEYIGNILYVLLLRKLPTKVLAVLTGALGVVLASITIPAGYLGVGWTLPEFFPGLVRMLFPYCLGMLLSRSFTRRMKENARPVFGPKTRKNSFIICSLVLLVLLPMPFVGSEESMWINGVYVTVVVVAVFPKLIWLAAEGSLCPLSQPMQKAATLLGEISYPLYAVHYPVMYLFYKLIGFPNVTCTMKDFRGVAVGIVIFCLALAYAALKLYDIPVRRYLSKRFVAR